MRSFSRKALDASLLLCGALAALCATSACGDSREASPAEPAASPGAVLFRKAGCGTCHGPDGAGLSSVGPQLTQLSKDWTSAELVDYIRDPLPFRESKAHLEELSAGFFAHMRPFPELNKDDRGVLAVWLLESF